MSIRMIRIGGFEPISFRGACVEQSTYFFRASGPRAILALSLCFPAAASAAAGSDGPTTEIFTGIAVEDNSTQGYVGAG